MRGFRCAKPPDATNTIRILATIAQHGREMISVRINRKLGTQDPKHAIRRMAEGRNAKAEQFAASVLPLIRAIEASGFTSDAAIAAELNARNVPTAHGKQWTPVLVGRVRSRSLED